MSTGNHSPCGLSRRLSSSSTMPGSTTQRRPATSSSITLVEIFRAVDDQRRVDGLPALRGAAAARRDRHALFPRDLDRPAGFLDRARRHHADRHDLVVRGVGGIAAAAEAVEHDVAGQLRLQAAFQAGPQRFRHGRSHSREGLVRLAGEGPCPQSTRTRIFRSGTRPLRGLLQRVRREGDFRNPDVLGARFHHRSPGRPRDHRRVTHDISCRTLVRRYSLRRRRACAIRRWVSPTDW